MARRTKHQIEQEIRAGITPQQRQALIASTIERLNRRELNDLAHAIDELVGGSAVFVARQGDAHPAIAGPGVGRAFWILAAIWEGNPTTPKEFRS